MIRILIIILLCLSSTAFAAEFKGLKPYKASYSVKYMGVTAGLVHFVLLPQNDDSFVYLTRVEPGLLARIVISPEAFERTILEVGRDGVRPLSWQSEDGSSGTEDDGLLTFDWDAERVYGTVEDEKIDLPAEPGLQNRLSMQIDVLLSLQNDLPPKSIRMIDGDKLKKYAYQLIGSQHITTDAGNYETVLYESTRKGSSRLKKIYHAPKLDYIPVRFENYKNGKLQTVMELVDVTLS